MTTIVIGTKDLPPPDPSKKDPGAAKPDAGAKGDKKKDVGSDDKGSGLSKKVVGPVRIWHALVAAVLGAGAAGGGVLLKKKLGKKGKRK